jgi:hypothetical protein
MATKKVLILGSGMVVKPCVDYLLRDTNSSLTIGRFKHWAAHLPGLSAC